MANKHVLIIGAGLGGLCAAIKLQESGFTFTIVEKLDKVGGTWAQNTYPGVACDVPVSLYQFSFAPSVAWSSTYPQGGEIQDYAEEITDRYQLRPNIHLADEAVSAVWDEDSCTWTLTTQSGKTFTGDALIGALGQLNRPNWPDIPGLEAFEGPKLHSAAWDHSVDMKGKKVGIVGSAASAVQIIPEIAEEAAHLTVFQRSPNWVVPRRDVKTSPQEVALMMTKPDIAMELGAANRKLIYDNADYFFWQVFEWTEEGRAAYTKIATDHLHAQIKDPDMRAQLTPDYPVGCRRILITDDFYPALCRDDVSLVCEGPSSIEAKGARTSDGALHEFDIMVFATGFETTGWRWSVDVVGQNDQHLNAVWADGPEAYLGITIADFPNLFVLYGPNTNLGHNAITFMLERQVEYAVKSLQGLVQKEARAMAPSRAAQTAFNDKLQADLAKTVWADPHCNSWYKTEDGKITQNWSSHTRAYADAVAEVKFEDYELV
ncbi:MAG: NAD(P)/FAD-dependent oxidoreductase [Henriciella sp.]|nr:NAD(P)/FAD-dependent oxidoreductase [Henriciella sp.]